MKSQGHLGSRADRASEIKFLKRVIQLEERGLSYEADPTFVDRLLEEWDMQNCKAALTLGTKEKHQEEGEETMVLLGTAEAVAFMRGVATLNYLSLDRPDISFTSKEVSRKMSNPNVGDLIAFKTILRYLRGSPRLQWWFGWQPDSQQFEVLTDSDWASCVRTRRSTSGGVIRCGAHLISHWSRTQATVALSSGEAELNGTVKAAAEGLYLLGVSNEFDMNFTMLMKADSTASLGILVREGAAPLKHLSLKQLWIQEKVADKVFKVVKVPRASNVADALTHHWTRESSPHYAAMGLRSCPPEKG